MCHTMCCSCYTQTDFGLYRTSILCVQVLQKICWFVVLAATSSDQVTLLNGTAADRKLDGLPDYKELLQTFITQEVCLYYK